MPALQATKPTGTGTGYSLFSIGDMPAINNQPNPQTQVLPTHFSVSDMPAFKAAEDADASIRMMRGALQGYYSNTDKPICFDKSRGWSGHLETATEMMGEDIKVLVPVREMTEVLASFENIWRKNQGHREIPQEKRKYYEFRSVEGRMATWMDPKEPVGAAYNAVRDAVHRGFRKNLFFIDYDELTKDPSRTMRMVYDFLQEEYFEHDFNNVEQVTSEKDEYYGFDELHTIRPKVEPLKKKADTLLGPAALRYKDLSFWNNSELGLFTNLKKHYEK
jgi:sulfotransferase